MEFILSNLNHSTRYSGFSCVTNKKIIGIQIIKSEETDFEQSLLTISDRKATNCTHTGKNSVPRRLPTRAIDH